MFLYVKFVKLLNSMLPENANLAFFFATVFYFGMIMIDRLNLSNWSFFFSNKMSFSIIFVQVLGSSLFKSFVLNTLKHIYNADFWKQFNGAKKKIIIKVSIICSRNPNKIYTKSNPKQISLFINSIQNHTWQIFFSLFFFYYLLNNKIHQLISSDV